MADKAASIDKPGLISVILVNWNGLRLLKGFMPSLASQTYKNVETIMVDNGSTDGSPDWVMQNYPAIRLLRFDGNRGFSVANNVAIRESRGEFVLTLNIDMLLEPDFIEKLLNGLTADTAAGWAAPRLLKLTKDFEKGQDIDCLGHHMTRTRFAREADISKAFDMKDYEQRRYVFGASACGALYRRAMLEDIAVRGEYFDEDFFAYFEDVDLDWRAQLRGWKCVYVHEAVGYHMRGGTGLKMKNSSIAACEFSNRFFLMMKNDSLSHFVQDLKPILKRTLQESIKYLRENPRAFFLGLARLIRYTPRIARKRAIIQRRRKATAGYIRSMIRGIG